jgi:hypothetical protein
MLKKLLAATLLASAVAFAPVAALADHVGVVHHYHHHHWHHHHVVVIHH